MADPSNEMATQAEEAKTSESNLVETEKPKDEVDQVVAADGENKAKENGVATTVAATGDPKEGDKEDAKIADATTEDPSKSTKTNVEMKEDGEKNETGADGAEQEETKEVDAVMKEETKSNSDPHIGKAFERNKMLLAGYPYPLQGKVVAYEEPSGRLPARWNVQWESTEDVVLQDSWVTADLGGTEDGQGALPTTDTTTMAVDVIQSRYEQNLEHVLESNQMLSTLLLYAAMEEALQTSLHQQQENSQTTSKSGKSSAHPPVYYSANPSSYLQPPTATDTAPSYSETKLQMTPANLAQRVRIGCQWAWNYLVAQQPPSAPPPVLTSATQRRSLRQPKPQPLPAVPMPTSVQRGGRVAMWWLEELEKQRAKEEEKEKGKEPAKKQEAKAQEQEVKTEIEEARKTETKAPPASDDQWEASAEEVAAAMADEDEKSEESGTKAGDDEDYDAKDTEEEDEGDDVLVGVEKERKGDLSPVPDANESSEEEEDVEEEDDENDITFENPYLQPSFPAFLEHMAKPKALSGQDIQTALCETVLRIRHYKRVSNHGLLTSSLASVDEFVLDQETPDYPPGKVVLNCVSGESFGELQKLDPQTFSRCKFSLDIIGDQEKSQQVQRQQELLEQEAEFKERKAWAKWRHRGIHEGYTSWPSWNDAIAEWAKTNCSSEEVPSETSNKEETTTKDDEALAKSLEENEASSAPSRRARRGGRTEGGVFYGNQSQLTQKQLMDALVRLVKTNKFQTMIRLQDMVADDSADPIRRCRVALGKLVWKRNQLSRRPVSAELSDSKAVKLLAEKPLLSIQPPVEPMDASVGDNAAKPEKKELSKEEKVLIQYVKELHSTELQLRRLVLKHLTEIPVAIVATAADERPGSMESMDDADFDDADAIEWHTSGHDLMGKLIYRPEDSNPTSECHWYIIKHYSKSIESEGDSEEPLSVERRMRFSAEPAPAPGESYVEPRDILLLTEAQVHAGLKAAELGKEASALKSSNGNPFAGGSGEKITLVPVVNDEMDNSKEEQNVEIHARILGHDNVVDEDDGSVEYRILVSTEPGSSGLGEAFWATLDVRADDSSYVCQPLGDSTTWYSIGIFDYDQSSAAFKECENVISYLRKQSKAGPFLEPVDPVALNIPSYPEMVKNPMDVSTLEANLENEQYSRIPSGQSIGHTPVSKMLNGPFRKDVELIFDNAMLFNPPDDWIHQAAAQLKKQVLKKIADLSYAADQKVFKSGRVRQKSSVYVDEDSDVDMYEYESDQDDEFETGGRSRRKRKRASRALTNKDDYSSRAIEHQIRLQQTLRPDLDLRGPFANLPLNSDASSFALPPEWSCRRSTFTESTEQEDSSSKKRAQEMAELLALQRVVEENEAAGLRRSTRAHHEPSHKSKSRKDSKGIEFFLKEETIGTDSTVAFPTNRWEVEIQKEKRHEDYYSKLYQTYSKLLASSEEVSSFGTYANGSFPPYCGRVVPISEKEMSWEIRAPFVVPALRWVLRGLIRSDHLTSVEPMTTDLISGVIMTNDIYFWDNALQPFEVLDQKELQRKKRANKESDDESEEDIELSEYERLRAERVARNAERLKALGLA